MRLLHAPPEPPLLEGMFAPLRDTIDALWARLLQERGAEAAPTRLLFAGAEGEVGATTIAACAAIGLARNAREPVLLLEANVRNPGLAGLLGLPPRPGWCEVVRGEIPLEAAIQATALPHLRALLVGGAGMAAPGDLCADLVRDVLPQASREARFLLLDSPPLLASPETRLLLRGVDGVILVLRAGSTRRDEAAGAKRIVEQAGVPVLGAVLNRRRRDVPSWILDRRGG